ncbi:hypothetical protein VKT23_013236 [Stygiomarasmius scandens]|uniref:FAD-binding domain-containing protein n=1 Tax=Marasmiellus scandens TaxID=2682957 RepID=A0ABR1J6L5_9AGAR
MEKNRVLIIGAGSAGLLIAHALKKLNIPYTVFERDLSSTSRARDWSFGVYWAQSRLGECLPPGIDENYLLNHAQVDDFCAGEDFYIPCFNGETGELLKKVMTPYSIRLGRKKFLKVLKEDGGIDVKYGKRLSSIKCDPEGDTVTALFEDGTEEQGALLIGCEGAHSKVREYLVGAEKAALRPLPILTNAAVTSFPAEAALAIRKIHQRFMFSIHPEGCFIWMSVQDAFDPDPSKWTFMLLQTWPEAGTDMNVNDVRPNLKTKPAIVEDMRQRASVFAEPWKSIWQAIPDDAPVWHNRLSDWATEPWDNRNGRVTLAGDAAHPMTFHRGQGLNNAISDACTLLHALKDHYSANGTSPFAKALEVYESEVWERGKEAVLSSAKNSAMVHDWKTVAQSPLLRLGIKPRDLEGSGDNVEA